MQEIGERSHEAELNRLAGQLIVVISDPQGHHTARAYFRKAIDIAKGQSAKSWELRAQPASHAYSTSKQTRRSSRNAGRNLQRFTEGFDSADLKDAKELLDEF